VRYWKAINRLVPALGLGLRYYSRVFGRAMQDTVTLIGWQKKSLVFPIAYLIGFLWFVRARGFLPAFQALLEDWYLLFVPAGIGVGLVFLYHLMMAPVQIAEEQSQIIRDLQRQQPGTSEDRTDLIRQRIHTAVRQGNEILAALVALSSQFHLGPDLRLSALVDHWTQQIHADFLKLLPEYAADFLTPHRGRYKPFGAKRG